MLKFWDAEGRKVGRFRVGEVRGDVEVWGGWRFYSRNSYEFRYEGRASRGSLVVHWLADWDSRDTFFGVILIGRDADIGGAWDGIGFWGGW